MNNNEIDSIFNIESELYMYDKTKHKIIEINEHVNIFFSIPNNRGTTYLQD